MHWLLEPIVLLFVVSTAAALNVESEIYTNFLETLMMKVRIMT